MSPAPDRDRRGIPLRAVVPNAVTALALCSGLTGIRFGISGNWDKAVMFVAFAAVLDGMDGRIARALKGQSRFGAELDSLSDLVAFGVAPGLIVYLWVLRDWNPYGWIFALAYAVCMALRLARFNARIDVEDQPHKSAGFLTGVPAPAGAAVMLLPILLWLASDGQWTWLKDYRLVAPWAAFSAFMIISSVATWSLGSLRLRRNVRLEAIVLIAILGGALFSAPWETLSLIVIVYLSLIPFSMASFARIRRQRAGQPGPGAAAPASLHRAVPADRPARRRRSGPNAPSE
ncbi:MAG: CDP-diacylglycerol---serine O-phosphatidyltransferase [Frankiaceae bacterium]|nr:CDP-diacylglycerol---serine O-phosphatidyltransferase [Frankiaceae bacterium]